MYSGKLTGALAEDFETLMLLERYKGWFFVVVTAFFLYLLILRLAVRLKREAARALDSERRFQQLFESQMIGVVLSDESSEEILEFNHGFEELLGYKAQDLPLRWRDITPERWHAGDAAWMDEARGTGVLTRREKEYLRKDGKPIPVLVGGIRLPDVKERWIGFVVDIREQKKAQRKLKELLQEMEDRVRERTRELEKAMVQAQSADRLKSVFLATMSHELRTPLNSVIGFVVLLRKGLAGPINAEQEKQLGMVLDSARHLLDLINDVLDISKIEAGQLILFPEEFELSGVLSASIDLFREAAVKKGLLLECREAGADGRVHTDRRRLQQILINLLSNAVKFTDEGSIRLEVSAMEEDHGLCIAVSDTGPGIAPEHHETIFQPFMQVENGSTRHHDGTGLGLSISRRLAEAMGGRLSVRSEPETGSVFLLELPGVAVRTNPADKE